MSKKVIEYLAKISFYMIVYFITYFGGLFFKRPMEPELDASWETSRERIYQLGIDYWVSKIDNLGLKKTGIDVLEVGSGNGQWLIAFSRFANSVCGIEPGDEIRAYSLERIKEFGLTEQIEVRPAIAEAIPYENETYDLLFCSGVFMFTKQVDALNEFSRVLKINGLLLITANGLGYFIMYILRGMRCFSVEETRYGLIGLINSWIKWGFGKQLGTCAVSHTEMRNMLQKQGLELVDTRLWLGIELYPLEHIGFVTNYAFVARKS